MTTTSTPSLATQAEQLTPGIAEIDAAITAVTARRQAMGQVPLSGDGAVQNLLAEVLAELEATGEWPADFAERASAAHARGVADGAERTALGSALDTLRQRRKSLLVTPAPEAIEFLQELHDELLVSVRDLAPRLEGVTSADDAVRDPDSAEAWGQLQACADRRAEIVAAWLTVVRGGAGGDNGETSRNCSRLLQQFPTRTGGPAIQPAVAAIDDKTVRRRTLDLNDPSERAEFLLWLADQDDAWLPDPAELAERDQQQFAAEMAERRRLASQSAARRAAGA